MKSTRLCSAVLGVFIATTASGAGPPTEDPDIAPIRFDPTGKWQTAPATLWATQGIEIRTANGKRTPGYRDGGSIGLVMPAGTYVLTFGIRTGYSRRLLPKNITVTMEPGHTYRLFWEQVGSARPNFYVDDLGSEKTCSAYFSLAADVPMVNC